MTSIIVTREKFGHKHERHREGCHMRMEAEIIVIHLQVKGLQGLPATTSNQRETQNRLPQSLLKETTVRHFGFELLASRIV